MQGATSTHIKEGLLKAMRAEREGQHFYLMAAQSTKDAKGKEVFTTLAREELEHFEYLKKQYRSVVETGAVDPQVHLSSPSVLEGSSPIFSDSLRSRISDAHFEMTALSIGIQLELDAQKFYRAEADRTDDSAARDFYLRLAEWEAGHYKALLAQSDSLKDDYWSKGGFAPF